MIRYKSGKSGKRLYTTVRYESGTGSAPSLLHSTLFDETLRST